MKNKSQFYLPHVDIQFYTSLVPRYPYCLVGRMCSRVGVRREGMEKMHTRMVAIARFWRTLSECWQPPIRLLNSK